MKKLALLLSLIIAASVGLSSCSASTEVSVNRSPSPKKPLITTETGLKSELQSVFKSYTDRTIELKNFKLTDRTLEVDIVEGDLMYSWGNLQPLSSVYCWFDVEEILVLAQKSKLVENLRVRIFIPEIDRFGNYTKPKLAMKVNFLEKSVQRVNTETLGGWELSSATTSYWMTDDLRNH